MKKLVTEGEKTIHINMDRTYLQVKNPDVVLLEADCESEKQYISSRYSKSKQLFATISATLGCLLNGLVMGYTGPALPSLTNSTAVNVYGERLTITAQEGSWIAGLVSIGCLVGSLMAGPTMDRFGRRFALMVVSSGSFLLGFTLMLLADSALHLYIGRMLNGIGLGFVMATSSVYIIEIGSTDFRGYLGCFIQLMWSVGVLIVFVLGCFLNWWHLILAQMLFVVPYVGGMYFSPESPRWLFLHGRDAEGRAALEWLRGPGKENIIEERIIRQEIEIRKSESVSLSLLTKAEIIKPFSLAILMMFFRNMSGMGVMIAYCNTILQHSGTEFEANISSVMVGAILFLSCLAATLVINKFGRKLVLVISILGMGASFAVLGSYFYYIQSYEGTDKMVWMGATSWVPCGTILVLLFLGNGGYGTIVWVVIAEIMPKRVRSVANSVIIFVAYLLGFVSTKTFVDFTNAIGEGETFWLYATVCLVGGIFTLIFVPETRGKSLLEIEEAFAGKDREKELELELVGSKKTTTI